jgi:abortive infection bacteriophage resistance protein
VFNVVLIIHYLLKCISPNNDWLAKLKTLFTEYPDISKETMGFPENWKENFL